MELLIDLVNLGARVISIIARAIHPIAELHANSDHLSAIASPLNTGITLKFQKKHPLDREKTPFNVGSAVLS